jgi:hypothetical protein
MERNMIDDASGVRLRGQPLSDAEFKGKCIADCREYEEKLKDTVFPPAFEKYLKG